MSETDDDLEARMRRVVESREHPRADDPDPIVVSWREAAALLRAIDRERARADRHIQLHTIEEARVWALTTRLAACERVVRAARRCQGYGHHNVGRTGLGSWLDMCDALDALGALTECGTCDDTRVWRRDQAGEVVESPCPDCTSTERACE
jgi:hypothetical protein